MGNLLSIKQKIGLGVIVILFSINVIAWQHIFVLAGPQYLKVQVLDVGQGDAILIETPSLHRILIDGGPDSLVAKRLAERLPFWEKKLDVVILTHPDADHANGLLQILPKYNIDYIVWTGVVRDGGLYEKWLELLKEKKKQGTKIVLAKMGQKITSDKVVLNVVGPLEDLAGQYFKNTTNETGIVLRATHHNNSFLLTADIGIKTEKKLLDNNIDLTSDVIKVAHHGSKYSSSEEFLQAVNPFLAVISVGGSNTYGHPTSEVLQKFSNFGITTLRTDTDGTVQIVSDGENIKVIRLVPK